MIEPVHSTIASLLAGVAGGFLSSFMAWNANLEKFDFRKHGNALIIGTLSGLAIGAGSAIVNPDIELPQLLVQIVLTFLSAVGLDRLRSNATEMVANKAITEIKKEGQPLPSPPPAPPSAEEPKSGTQ